MKKFAMAAAGLALAAGSAQAGGIERRGDPSQILFEKGKNYVEFSAVSVNPNVSGVARPGVPGAPTGNIQDRFQNYGAGYKYQLNDHVALAFVIDEPVGANVTYSNPGFYGGGSFFGTSTATVDSIRYAGMAKYNATERFSVYGGVTYVGLGGDLTVNSPTTGGLPPTATPPGPGSAGSYSLSVDKDFQAGYILGVAYEIPDIALRFALSYESETEHKFSDNTGATFKVKLPQSLTLHAQSGIAANTLLFGSVRWREWSKFQVEPQDFFSFATGAPVVTPIAFGTDDVYTYRLGIGRRFNDEWSGAFALGYEKQTGNQVGNLEGTDGYISYTVAISHKTESLDVTAALTYIDIGNAHTSVATFRGNSALAFGLKVGVHF